MEIGIITILKNSLLHIEVICKILSQNILCMLHQEKENLAVFYHQPSDGVLSKAREWFGADNVINMSSTNSE